MPYTVNVSVRGIVELVLRSGSIDSRYISSKRAYEGVMTHQRLQKKRKAQAAQDGTVYEREVTLRKKFVYEDFEFAVDGRADGIIHRESPPISPTTPTTTIVPIAPIAPIVIEEIKSTTRPVDEIDEPSELHWAQLKCYGYIYASENGLEEISLRLTYCAVETDDLAEFEYVFGIGELTAFFYQLIELYYVFARADRDRITARNETCATLAFPFASYRKNQRELAVSVFRAIKRRGVLFAQAPTGTGKTISTAFPAVKALGEGLCSKIFYLTAKTTTRQAACDALTAMSANGLVMRSIVLTAKDKLCPNEAVLCRPDACAYADGHFDRVNAAVLDIISNETVISRETVAVYAEKHRVCPFEFGLDIALFCDFIVCDYNHVYDPSVRLRRFFDEKNDFCLLVDEAHNLVDRARDMFSAALCRSDFKKIKKSGLQKGLSRLANKIIAHFKEPDRDTLRTLLTDFTSEADKWLATAGSFDGAPVGGDGGLFDDIMELYFKVLDYLRADDFFDERYEFYTDRTGGDPSVKLLCLDPSYLLGKVHARVKSAILFSATLSPPAYFMDVLSGVENCKAVSIPSPFDKNRLAVFIDARVSARYADRAASLDIISRDLNALTRARPGNYLAFFPSYEYMNAVHGHFAASCPETETIRQHGSMTERERGEFLARFDSANRGSLLGFAVMGGVFSEGIDLLGDKLIGAAIISVGLPLITRERDLLSRYYKSRLGLGFEYAYKYPGLIKVMQAAGRVIRSDSDKGTVLLLDDRFAQYGYRSLFPPEWADARIINGACRLEDCLYEFWENF